MDKGAAIWADDNFKCIYFNENDRMPLLDFTKSCSQESNCQ